MFNYDGVKTSDYLAPRQILANVEFQYSIGCMVPKSLGVDVTSNGVTRKIVKAGTPIVVDLSDIQTPAEAPTEASGNDPAVEANAVLLHDVDVTDAGNGTKNGTALLFGFVNYNRLDDDVKELVSCGVNVFGKVTILAV